MQFKSVIIIKNKAKQNALIFVCFGSLALLAAQRKGILLISPNKQEQSRPSFMQNKEN